ncbi:MAG: hypothetical protein DRH30_00615, partial [Deltaproteobacteria bacterium]
MSDTTTIRERHIRNEWPDTVCKTCRRDWPCDTAILQDALDELTDERDTWVSGDELNEYKARYVEAQARADKAEAALQH